MDHEPKMILRAKPNESAVMEITYRTDCLEGINQDRETNRRVEDRIPTAPPTRRHSNGARYTGSRTFLALGLLACVSNQEIHRTHAFSTPLILSKYQTSPSLEQGPLSHRQASLLAWYPKTATYDDDIFSEDIETEQLEDLIVSLTANLVLNRLYGPNENAASPKATVSDKEKQITKNLVQGRFIDLTCRQTGEEELESLFLGDDRLSLLWHEAKLTAQASNVAIDDVIRGAVMVLQSLCIMGSQVGVKGQPDQLRRMVDHLADSDKKTSANDDWTNESVRRLKYQLDRAPALHLLATIKCKQSPQGAFDLLVALGVWQKHEDLALLRSGFPIRFCAAEEQAAATALQQRNNGVDVDAVLGLRQDLRHLKVYTIDGASTSEIDDGVSIEVLDKGNHRIWIHIADAERWAPPSSDLFEAARRRITSLYLPQGPISMFPPAIGSDLMSLKSNQDVYALSLGIQLNEDGSIDESSLLLTPSLIRVSFRLTYDEVDEMLEEGVGYSEEWELGALLSSATKRREYRIANGSTEGVVPNPIPYGEVSIYPDENAADAIGIKVTLGVSHNAAKNKTATAEYSGGSRLDILEQPLSSAYLLVTEAMILAGEGIGRWKGIVDANELALREHSAHENNVRLPFRTQRQPDFKSRSRERAVMFDLLESSAGKGLCHAWYTRRFLESVSVMENRMPHAGLGLEAYVQWSSPIRRFSDLQVHSAVKRYLRRQKVYELVQNGLPIPDSITAHDIGVAPDAMSNGRLKDSITADELDNDINFMEGVGLIVVGKKLQRQSQQYWLFEHIRRLKAADPGTTFKVIVLGCVDPEKGQFAIYVEELGLEHRFTAPGGRLEPGTELVVKVDNVSPRSGLLSFVAVV